MLIVTLYDSKRPKRKFFGHLLMEEVHDDQDLSVKPDLRDSNMNNGNDSRESPTIRSGSIRGDVQDAIDPEAAKPIAATDSLPSLCQKKGVEKRDISTTTVHQSGIRQEEDVEERQGSRNTRRYRIVRTSIFHPKTQDIDDDAHERAVRARISRFMTLLAEQGLILPSDGEEVDLSVMTRTVVTDSVKWLKMGNDGGMIKEKELVRLLQGKLSTSLSFLKRRSHRAALSNGRISKAPVENLETHPSPSTSSTGMKQVREKRDHWAKYLR